MTNEEFMIEYNAVKSPLYFFALKLTQNSEESKDLLQETAYRAAKSKNKFQRGTNFKAWTSTILRNLFINYYRKLKFRYQIENQRNKTNAAFNNTTIENSAVSKLLIGDILEIAETLVTNQKDALLLYQ
ncbi:MAG: RNA polymerase sigma factor (sigma-70 family) [Saprospiraceae bacterium]|jgi:RNA polymerase sigma factor (sigma-70 family)